MKKIILAVFFIFICGTAFAGPWFDTFFLNESFKVNVSPYKCTTIHLQEGEMAKTGEITISNKRWMVKANEYGENRKVIILKAPDENQIANLIISTNRRVYNIDLISDPDSRYNDNVKFSYPPDIEKLKREAAREKVMKAMESTIFNQREEIEAALEKHGEMLTEQAKLKREAKDANAPITLKLEALMPGDNWDFPKPEKKKITSANDNLNFSYKYKKKYGWSPVAVFDNGEKTFIYFSEKIRHGELPILYAYSGKQMQTINYRYDTERRRYVVDGIFRDFILIADKKRLKIKNTKRDVL